VRPKIPQKKEMDKKKIIFGSKHKNGSRYSVEFLVTNSKQTAGSVGREGEKQIFVPLQSMAMPTV
jgi:hypothetical protein